MGICSAFTPSWESAAQRQHDGEPGFRHAAKAGDTPVETSWDNRAHRRGGAATATRNPLQGNCPVVTAGLLVFTVPSIGRGRRLVKYLYYLINYLPMWLI